MGPQNILEIYIRFKSPSIIKYVELLTRDLFTAQFADCYFDETIFPILRGENKQPEKKISWNELSLSHFDSRTKQCKLEVRKIFHLQRLAEQLLDALSDPKGVTKSYIPAANTHIKINVLGKLTNVAHESKAHMKCDRTISFKNKITQKQKKLKMWMAKSWI